MAATLATTFALIRCVRGSLYGDIWNVVQSVCVGEALNCEREVKNPLNLYVVSLRKYGTTVGHTLLVLGGIDFCSYDYCVKFNTVITILYTYYSMSIYTIKVKL